MIIDYKLESFRVPDLHPRSQEPPPKSGRVPDFFENIFFDFSMFLDVWGDLWTFFFKYFLGTKFLKRDCQNFWNGKGVDKEQSQWVYKSLEQTDIERRKMIGAVLDLAIEANFKLH